MIDDNRKNFYKQQLRNVAQASRWLANPNELAQRINEHIVKREPELIRAIVATRFATEGKSNGAQWKALALRTAIQRRRLGFQDWNPILRRSGLLMRGAVGGKLQAFPNRIEITFKDGPAPNYTGKGRASKQKARYFVELGGKSRRVSKKSFDLWRGPYSRAKTAMRAAGTLMTYASQLNDVRPFYGAPSQKETEVVRSRAREILAEVLRRVASGQAAGI